MTTYYDTPAQAPRDGHLYVPTSDHTVVGATLWIGTLGENSVTSMMVVALQSDGFWDIATNTTEAKTDTLLAFALHGGDSGDIVRLALPPGFIIRDDTWNWTPAQKLWLSTAGAVTSTQPAVGGTFARPLGYALTADTAFIMLGPTVEIAA